MGEDKQNDDNKSVSSLNDQVRCGWCCWRPDCLQTCYRWQTALVLMCCFGFVQGFVVHGVTPVNTSSLENRFKLSSTEIGWFNSAMELSAAVTCLIFCYIADRSHKPRWLMISSILFSIGCFVMALPHFIAEPYDGNSKHEVEKCSQHPTNTTDLSGDCSGHRVSLWLNVLVVGNVILGCGAGVIYTIGMAFIDDFSSPESSGFRAAVMMLFGAAGSAAGFASGSVILRLDVNFNRPDWPTFEGNKDFNPHYVGAWWVGYIIGTAAFGAIAFGFSCFDYELPESARIRATKPVETHEVGVKVGDDTSGRNKLASAVIQFAGALLKLICNPVLLLVTIAYITHGLMADGITPFFIKIIRTQFVMNERKAGLTIAIMVVVAIGLGSIVSGIVIRRLKPSLRTLLLMVLLFVTLATFVGIGFLLRCPQEKILGMTAKYDDEFNYYNPIEAFEKNNLKSACNAPCACSPDDYQPICHRTKGIQFFSPCYASCRQQRSVKRSGMNITVYADCRCLLPLYFAQQEKTTNVTEGIMKRLLWNNEWLPPAVADARLEGMKKRIPWLGPQVESYRNFSKDPANVLVTGVCDTSCSAFYAAMVAMFFILFFGYFTMVPLWQIVMRCVPVNERSFALAFFTSMQRFLGSIPGPIMVGRMIDSVCIYRDPNVCSGDTGACFVYNVKHLAYWIVGVFVGLHVIAIICYVAAFFLYKPPNGESFREYFGKCCKKNENNATNNGGNSEATEISEIPSNSQITD